MADDWTPSDSEKELLKRTFSYEFDFLFNFGTDIYAYIFGKHPHLRQLFPKFQAYGDDYPNSQEFRAQALKFAQVISQGVVNMYHTEKLPPILQKVGARHVKYIDRGFRSAYFDVIQEAILGSLAKHIAVVPELSDEQRVEATNAWQRLALYITLQMKRGFSDELVRCGKHEPQ